MIIKVIFAVLLMILNSSNTFSGENNKDCSTSFEGMIQIHENDELIEESFLNICYWDEYVSNNIKELEYTSSIVHNKNGVNKIKSIAKYGTKINILVIPKELNYDRLYFSVNLSVLDDVSTMYGVEMPFITTRIVENNIPLKKTVYELYNDQDGKLKIVLGLKRVSSNGINNTKLQ